MAALSSGGAAVKGRLRILVRGAVQGVGFRPFVFRLATRLGLSGWVGNSTEGVVVEAEGDPERIADLIEILRGSPPGHATIDAVTTTEVPIVGERSFAIRPSASEGERSAALLPDLAPCTDCLAELFDGSDRRYLYPFINCTRCGPRFSIMEDLPYDRERTSMRHFRMCATCREEYADPANRRFHAEANACPACGPRLSLRDRTGRTIARDHEALLAAAAALRGGNICAVKGVGGFHLMVDARDEAAVRRLRARKRRSEKPFAVMFPTLSDVAASCSITAEEERLSTSAARPIVLLRRTSHSIAPAVAPGNPRIGALLPYSPLHELLMHELGFPVVATSGNVTEEPIVTDEQEALRRLGAIADCFLVHDRPIVRPVEDSVVRLVGGHELVLRRARGLAPARFACSGARPGILAVGGHLKTTVASTYRGGAVLGSHLGDLETAGARSAHARAVADVCDLYATSPRLVVRDLHPDYASSRLAEELGRPVLAVQHHLAHVWACMAEHGLVPPVLGVAWDGTGYGTDRTVWGGEFLLITADGWRRVAHLRRFRLPGGETAAREPRRAALGLLFEAFGREAFAMTDLPPVAALAPREREVLRTMLEHGLNSPVCSSAGRLFDAFAALCGLRQRASYEGQAAAELEWAAEGSAGGRAYDVPLREPADADGALVLDWQPALEAALADLRAGVAAGSVAAALHHGLAVAIAAVAVRIGEGRVILTGGCFQNAVLTEAAVAALRAVGCEPHRHRRVPPNDGGIALGQAAWAAWSEARGWTPCA